MVNSDVKAAPPASTPEAVVPGPDGSGGRRRAARVRRALGIAAAAALALLAATRWWQARTSVSITDDAFVEAHIVNVAPEAVSGRIVRLLVDENDRVERGQVLAEIDPVPYRDKVNMAASRLEAARRELARQQADLERLRREVPIQIEIARRALAAAVADRAKAESSVELTEDDVEKGIDEARAGVKAAKADLLLARQDRQRFANLGRHGAVTRREQEESIRSHDSAEARVELAEAKLAKAIASRTQVAVARSALDAARTDVQRSAKAVDLAETGNDQIRVVELLVEVKKETVEEARRALESAEHDLAYTKVRAPISGVVVRRYRNLGDFASAGVAVLSMYDPDLLYVTANLEETRLPGVAPGVPVRLDVDAFPEPFRGRVVWVNKSTGAQFALMPRNVVSGEFTKVVQRVPVRIWIERDDPRWPQLRAGLSVRVAIDHGPGDPAWAEQAARRMAEIEGRFNQPEDGRGPDPPGARRGGRPMTATAVQAPAATAPAVRHPVLAALAVVPVLATVYQTIVLTDVTGDVIRKGIEGDSYQMLWTNLTWGIATLYGIFLGMWAMARIGARQTISIGLALFALGNGLCGASVDVPSLAAARLVEGIGKGMTIGLYRSTLYRQFDRAILVAVGIYGVIAYATRPLTPLVTAYVNDLLSWRWIYWVNVPIALLGLVLVRRTFRPDRPPKPLPLRIDWLAVTLLRGLGVVPAVHLRLVPAVGRLDVRRLRRDRDVLRSSCRSSCSPGSPRALSPDEHLRRLVRVRGYVLAMCVRMLLLVNFSAVLAVMGKYLVELRDYPREVAGWVMAPAAPAMAASTLLTTVFHRRALRPVWLLAGVLGSAGCLWWLSGIDNFTPKEHVAAGLACWGLFLGLFPPVFLTDEVEALERQDALYGGAVVGRLPRAPAADRADRDRHGDLRVDRPRARQPAAQPPRGARGRPRGAGPRGRRLPPARRGRARAIDADRHRRSAAFVKAESVARGFQDGLKFLSLTMLGIGLPLAALRFVTPPRQRLIADPSWGPRPRRDRP